MMLKNNCDFIRETSNVDYPIHFKGIAVTGERFDKFHKKRNDHKLFFIYLKLLLLTNEKRGRLKAVTFNNRSRFKGTWQ